MSVDQPWFDGAKAKELLLDALHRCSERSKASLALYNDPTNHLIAGVPSAYQSLYPHPIYIKGGKGSHIFDVDGNNYVDINMALGAALAGHCHPLIAASVASTATSTGFIFSAPTMSTIELSRILAEDYGMLLSPPFR